VQALDISAYRYWDQAAHAWSCSSSGNETPNAASDHVLGFGVGWF